jgi:hypothetical protein
MPPSEETGTHLYMLRGPEDSIPRTSILYHRTAELQIKLNTHFALNVHRKTSKQAFKSHTKMASTCQRPVAALMYLHQALLI